MATDRRKRFSPGRVSERVGPTTGGDLSGFRVRIPTPALTRPEDARASKTRVIPITTHLHNNHVQCEPRGNREYDLGTATGWGRDSINYIVFLGGRRVFSKNVYSLPVYVIIYFISTSMEKRDHSGVPARII